MPIALEFRFVTGEYHATTWDDAVNSGTTEWPPSPWRLLRALVATWHNRCPDLPVEVLEELIAVLAAHPPRYLLPDSRSSHTRHYMPAGDHLSGDQRRTSMTLAPRRHLDPYDPVVVLWPQIELSNEDAQALDRLVASIPYLGRAESRCVGRVLTAAEMESLSPEEGRWTRPVSHSPDLRVLAPHPPVTLAELEVTPDAMRRAKRLIPVGAQWVGYRSGQASTPQTSLRAPRPPGPQAVRWFLDSRAPFRNEYGLLATTGLRGAVLSALGGKKVLAEAEQSWLIAGPRKGSDAGRHRHAHWLWWSDTHGTIRELILWVPDGIPPEWVSRILSITNLPKFQDAPKGYRSGAALHVQAVGALSDVLPPITQSAARWRSRTPMATDRHPKQRRDPNIFINAEIRRELSFRSHWWPDPPHLDSVSVRTLATWQDREVTTYRRYRWTESMERRRRAFTVELDFKEPVAGPIILGALSHFGFGVFEPIPDQAIDG